MITHFVHLSLLKFRMMCCQIILLLPSDINQSPVSKGQSTPDVASANVCDGDSYTLQLHLSQQAAVFFFSRVGGPALPSGSSLPRWWRRRAACVAVSRGDWLMPASGGDPLISTMIVSQQAGGRRQRRPDNIRWESRRRRPCHCSIRSTPQAE